MPLEEVVILEVWGNRSFEIFELGAESPGEARKLSAVHGFVRAVLVLTQSGLLLFAQQFDLRRFEFAQTVFPFRFQGMSHQTIFRFDFPITQRSRNRYQTGIVPLQHVIPRWTESGQSDLAPFGLEWKRCEGKLSR